MPERVIFPDFRDQVLPTRYPFADNASLVSSDATGTIDNDLFIDASVYPIGAIGRIYIATISVATREVIITLADSTETVRASVSFDPLETTGLLRLHDTWNRPAGVLVSDPLRLARFTAWRPGIYTFAIDSTTFVASCVIPTPEVGVRGIITDRDELFTKDMLIVGDNGVVVTQEDESTIRVDIVGDVLFLRKRCGLVELFNTPNFIKTINGCPPDEFGNFNLTVGDHINNETIMRIYQQDGNLRIEAIGQTVKQNG